MDNKETADKKKRLFEKLIKAVTTVLKIRRGIKIFFAFGTGISMIAASYKALYDIIQYVPLSLYYAVLAGAATTAFTLLFMEIIRVLIGCLKKLGLKQLDKIKTGKKGQG